MVATCSKATIETAMCPTLMVINFCEPSPKHSTGLKRLNIDPFLFHFQLCFFELCLPPSFNKIDQQNKINLVIQSKMQLEIQ